MKKPATNLNPSSLTTLALQHLTATGDSSLVEASMLDELKDWDAVWIDSSEQQRTAIAQVWWSKKLISTDTPGMFVSSDERQNRWYARLLNQRFWLKKTYAYVDPDFGLLKERWLERDETALIWQMLSNEAPATQKKRTMFARSLLEPGASVSKSTAATLLQPSDSHATFLTLLLCDKVFNEESTNADRVFAIETCLRVFDGKLDHITELPTVVRYAKVLERKITQNSFTIDAGLKKRFEEMHQIEPLISLAIWHYCLHDKNLLWSDVLKQTTGVSMLHDGTFNKNPTFSDVVELYFPQYKARLLADEVLGTSVIDSLKTLLAEECSSTKKKPPPTVTVPCDLILS